MIASHGGIFRKISVKFLFLILVGALSACGSAGKSAPTATGGGENVDGGGESGSIVVTADPYSLSALETSTVTVLVADESGNPVADDTEVTFSLNDSSIGMIEASALTSGGTATAMFTASSNTGTVTITATALGKIGTVEITVTFAPAAITVTANPSTLSMEESSTVTATVRDDSGNFVADGTEVTFSLDDSDIGMVEASAVTSDGIATAMFTASTNIGTATVTAVSASVSGTVDITVTATPIPVDVVVVANPSTLSPMGTSTVTVNVVDSNGNPVADDTEVTFSLNDSSIGMIESSAVTTGGTATANFTALVNTGVVTVTATALGEIGTVDINVTDTAPPLPVDVVVFANPSSLSALETSTITVLVADEIGNPVADDTEVTFSLDDSSIGMIEASAMTSGGIATVTFTASTNTGTVTVTATALEEIGTVDITVTLAPAAITVTADPSTLSMGESSTVTATVRDNSGNFVADGTAVAFSVDDSSVGMIETSAVTSGGIATAVFTASSNTGTVTVTAVSASVSGTVDITVTVAPLPVDLVVVANPSTLSPLGTSTVTVMVVDGNGNPVADGTTVTFSLDDSSIGMIEASAVTSGGTATAMFTALINIGTVTVTAVAAGESGTVDIAVTGETGSIVVTADPSSLVGAGQTSTITANLNDSSNGTTVNFTLSADSLGAITLSAETINGVATAIFTSSDLTGTVTVTASSGALVGTTDITIGGATAAVTLTIVAVPATITSFGTSGLTATVLDSGGNSVPDGTVVNWSTNNEGLGTITESSTTSAGQALASFTAFDSPGAVTVTASSGSAIGTVDIEIETSETGSIEFESAVPSLIGIRGTGQTESSLVTFLVLDLNGYPVLDGTGVDFCLTLGPAGGRLPDDGGEFLNERDDVIESYTDANGNGCYDTGEEDPGYDTNGNNVYDNPLHAAVSTVDGVAEVIIHSGLIAGNVRVRATAIDTNVSSLTPVLSIGGGVPNMAHFTLSVDGASSFNLPGLAYVARTADITVYLADRFGNWNVLEGTTVSYYAESGAIDASTTIDAEGKTVVTFRTQEPYPESVAISTDTSAFSALGYNESAWVAYISAKYGISPTGYPRNGWATITAAVNGEESFNDENGNGVYDSGEAFTDTEGEVFVDSNDNGVWNDAGVDPWELYIDDNMDGVYTGANSLWDAEKTLFKDIKLLMTGGPAHIRITPTTFNITDGGSQTFNLFVSDANLNPLSTGSKITVTRTEWGTYPDTALGGTTYYEFPNTFMQGAPEHTFTLLDSGLSISTYSITITVKVEWEGYEYFYSIDGTTN